MTRPFFLVGRLDARSPEGEIDGGLARDGRAARRRGRTPTDPEHDRGAGAASGPSVRSHDRDDVAGEDAGSRRGDAAERRPDVRLDAGADRHARTERVVDLTEVVA